MMKGDRVRIHHFLGSDEEGKVMNIKGDDAVVLVYGKGFRTMPIKDLEGD